MISSFSEWFKGSFATDHTGAPKVVYRGEHCANTETFPNSMVGSISFGDSETASLYALDPNNQSHQAEAPRIFPCYLSIQKPFFNDLDDPFLDMHLVIDEFGMDAAWNFALKWASKITYTGNWDENFSSEFDDLQSVKDKDPQLLHKLYLDAYTVFDDRDFCALLIKHGFDGAIHGGMGFNAGEPEYKIFHPHQARSAISPDLPLTQDRLDKAAA